MISVRLCFIVVAINKQDHLSLPPSLLPIELGCMYQSSNIMSYLIWIQAKCQAIFIKECTIKHFGIMKILSISYTSLFCIQIIIMWLSNIFLRSQKNIYTHFYYFIVEKWLQSQSLKYCKIQSVESSVRKVINSSDSVVSVILFSAICNMYSYCNIVYIFYKIQM